MGAPQCAQLIDADEYTVAKLEPIVDSGARPPDAPSGTAISAECGGFRHAVADCASCVEQRCCDELSACRDDTECAALWECIGVCEPGDAACFRGCDPSTPPAVSIPASECVFEECPRECLVCGAVRISVGPEDDIECSTCVAEECCDEQQACLGLDECRALLVGGPRSVDAGPPSAEALAAIAGLNNCTLRCAACRPGEDWSCLGQFVALAPATVTVGVGVRLLDFASGGPVAGVEVSACNATDPACASPLDTVTTDSTGVAWFDLPAPFTGYWSADPSGLDYFPSLFENSIPISEDTTFDFAMPSRSDFNALAVAITAPPDPTRGHIIATLRDCSGGPAPGLTLDVSSPQGALRWYLVGPTPTAGALSTTGPGAAGFVNVDPTIVTLTVTREATAEVTATMTALVRAGWMTYASIVPTQ